MAERGVALCLQAREAFRRKSNRFPTAGVFFPPPLPSSFLQKDAAKSPESWKQWLKPDRWDKSQSGHKSRKGFQTQFEGRLVCFSLWEQAASGSDTRAAAGRAQDEGFEWQTAALFSGFEHKKVHAKTQINASIRNLIGFTWLVFGSIPAKKNTTTICPKGADCVPSGSGQSWPRSEYVSVICCPGFDPESLHQISNKACVFDSLTVSRGATMLRGCTRAIIRRRADFSRRRAAQRRRCSGEDERKVLSCQCNTRRRLWEMWPAHIQHSSFIRFLEQAIENAIFIWLYLSSPDPQGKGHCWF